MYLYLYMCFLCVYMCVGVGVWGEVKVSVCFQMAVQ